ncbi:MAG: methionine gamma-lyase family protein [Clostridia bacterium]|nr:methionine gamma-lyase family protein [Clostridia bacterium]
MLNEKILAFVNEAEKDCEEIFSKLEEIALFNQNKMLEAFQEVNLQLADIASSTGYGGEDRAKGKLSEIYAKAFGAEFGIVSPLIGSGTHALSIALFGLLRPNDTMLSITGKPYDTLLGVIFGEGNGSLKDFCVNYDDVDLVNNDFDFETIKEKVIKIKPKMIYIQRSRGYTSRESLSVDKIEKLIKFVREFDKDAIIMVDNCYGEFVEKREPTEVGADVMVGSLIKNAGGGIAPTGAYIVGKKNLIELISSRFIAPNIGLDIGSYAGSYTPFFQGCFLAPHITLNALKGNILLGRVAEKLGFVSYPKMGEMPHDLVRTFEMKTADNLIEFCRMIQRFSPVDSSVVPYPWDMPGYDDKVIMAAGAFIQGSSIELSADGPIREPYLAYLQGGLTYEHLKIVAVNFAERYLNV